MVSKVSSIHNGAALILLLLQVFAGELYIHTAEALDEGQVNAIVNENCTSYLKLYNTRLNSNTSAQSHGNISKFKYSTANLPQGEASHSKCPPWQFRKAGRQCRAGKNFKYLVNIEERTQQTWLQTFYCMTTSDDNTTSKLKILQIIMWNIGMA